MRMTDKKARQILDYLTKRMGFSNWELTKNGNFDSAYLHEMRQLEFLDSDGGWGSDLLLEKDGQLMTWGFYDDMSLVTIVKSMIKNADRAYCGRSDGSLPCQELATSCFPWIYVFKKNETLEKLLIEMDLNG